MYKIEHRKEQKILFIKAIGALTLEEGKKFVEDIKKNISAANTEQLYLVLDGTEVDTTAQEAIQFMEEANQLYFKTPFKGRFMILSKSAVASMQLKRVSKNVGSDMVYVSSYEEVLEKIK